MGRERAPCCQKVGLNKGSWTLEEDRRLIAYIHRNGYGNWRALPKQAGLLRCGKSCRLRWINYLRPDIKHGNFTKEEEDAIINLHETLGNKWSKIASCLPGRTDNEIKNVWNTHLKKRLKLNTLTPPPPPPPTTMTKAHEDSLSAASASTISHETSSSSTNGSEMKPFEPHFDMMDILGDFSMPTPSSLMTTMTKHAYNSLEIPTKQCQQWLADLEIELGLHADGFNDGDEITKRESSSPSTIDQVDFNSLNSSSWTKFVDFEMSESTS